MVNALGNLHISKSVFKGFLFFQRSKHILKSVIDSLRKYKSNYKNHQSKPNRDGLTIPTYKKKGKIHIIGGFY